MVGVYLYCASFSMMSQGLFGLKPKVDQLGQFLFFDLPNMLQGKKYTNGLMYRKVN